MKKKGKEAADPLQCHGAVFLKPTPKGLKLSKKKSLPFERYPLLPSLYHLEGIQDALSGSNLAVLQELGAAPMRVT